MAAERTTQTLTDSFSAKEQAVLEAPLDQLHDELGLVNQIRSSVALTEAGVSGSTTVLLTNGQRVAISNLLNRKVDVWCITQDWKITASHCSAVVSLGLKPVIKVTLASGRIIRATAKHRLFGPTGWVSVENLKIDDRVAMARRVPEPLNPITWAKDTCYC